MSGVQHHHIHDFMRGGQVTLHNFRMMGQVLRYLLGFGLLLLVTINAYWFFSHTTAYERYVLSRTLIAQFYLDMKNPEHTMDFRLSNGQTTSVKTAALMANPKIKNLLYRVKMQSWEGLLLSIKIVGGVIVLVVGYLAYSGAQKRKQHYRRGSQVIPPEALREVLHKEDKASDFHIAAA